MGAYRSLFAARFRALLQYRGAAIGGMACQIFFGLILVMVYEAFYRSGSRSQPMTISQVRSYVWLGQAFLAMLPWNVEGEQRLMIRTGSVAYELLRPVRLYSLWFARSLAWRTAPTVMRAVPILVVAMAFFGLTLPPSPAAAGAFILVMGGALLLSVAMTTLFTIFLMWTVSGDGFTMLLYAMVILLSGLNIPIPLFPVWLRPIVEALPFRCLVDVPYRMYVGYADPGSAFGLLALQLAWSGVTVGVGFLLMRGGLRRLTIQGG